MKYKMTGFLILTFAFVGNTLAQDAGKALFASKCAICHGADGAGKTSIGKSQKIRDFHSPEFQSQSDAEIKAVINKGKGKMQAYEGKLTPEQIDELVAYIRELGKQK